MNDTVEPENPFDIWTFLQSLRNDCWQPHTFVIGYANLLKQSDLDDDQLEHSELNEAETTVNIQIQMPPQKYLPDYPGSDLDLARQILKHHNSELKIQEEKDKTIFRFALPLWQDK